MNQKPLFSVVIPTYNHAHLIIKCLDSLISQTYSDWEAIVVNNFSQDNTIEVIESYNDPRIRLINNANDGIIAVSRNRGIAEAKGEWICFLDSDDWWTPNKLEACLPYLENYDMLYHDMRVSPVPRHIFKKRVLKGKDLPIKGTYETLLMGPNPIINSSVVIRRNEVDRIGAITEDRGLIAVEDYDYWLRAAHASLRFKYIPQVLGYYWIAGGNISFNIKQLARINALYVKHLNGQDDVFARNVENHIATLRGRILHLAGQRTQAISYYKQAWSTTRSIKALVLMAMAKFGK